ncbi:magnesium transporter MgtE N-terminal domain-containing protein [Effusibacillus dendaii]|uniref:Magnesium transporter MgtE intracellular domain-containing protein n=1 Tax=Effusibacillus dendaii TaxID=2743772 RepID=A0A7I8D554_9BACL|nr:hypothetical protein [Effusibacillus dendaii]BCJ85263.1 hypothetical protein skT53_02480 [Effusibacillus dendaii]
MAEQTERNYGKMEWLFYMIILPLLFTSVMVGLVLQLMGYNVTGKLLTVARHTPGLSAIIPPDEATKQEQSQVSKLQKMLEDVKQALGMSQQTNDLLKADLDTKNSELAKLQQQAADKLKADQQLQQNMAQWKQQAKMYSNMSPQNAASILSQMPVADAKNILSVMNADAKASILEKMDPQKAAGIESGVAVQNAAAASPFTTNQAKVYGLMNPAKAAAVLSSMPVADSRQILSGMNPESRAPILENMDPKYAASIETGLPLQTSTPTSTPTASAPVAGPPIPSSVASANAKSSPYYTEAARIYGSMSPDKAASILSQLPLKEIRDVMYGMEPEARSKILEKLDPNLAARVQSSNVNEPFPAQGPTNVYDAMDPAKAASILAQLPIETTTEKLMEMGMDKRAEILSKMKPEDAARISIEMDKDYWPSISNWSTQANIYERMDPAAAAKIVQSMPPAQAKQVVDEMDRDKRDEMIKYMDPKKVAQIMQQ